MSRKASKFLDYYYGPEANGNALQAARLAGFKNPDVDAYKVKKRLALVMQEREAKEADRARLSAEQVVQKLCEVAEDKENPAQRVRALEILAKIHGLTNDKVHVTVDRKAMGDDLEAGLAKLAELMNRQALPIGSIDVTPIDSTICAKLLPPQ